MQYLDKLCLTDILSYKMGLIGKMPDKVCLTDIMSDNWDLIDKMSDKLCLIGKMPV